MCWLTVDDRKCARPLEAGVPSKMARHLFYPGDAPRGINSLGRDYACVLLKQCRTHLGIQLDARCTLDSPPYRGPAFLQLATLSSIFLSLFAPPFLSLFSSHSRRLSLSLCFSDSLYRSGFCKSFRRTNAAA